MNNASRGVLRLPLLALGILIGVAAMWAGLARIGWQLPLAPAELILSHGPLMVGGFLGTLIGLERAVALDRPWWYTAPLSAGMAAAWLLIAGPNPVSAGLFSLSALIVCLMFATMARRHNVLYMWVLLTGAVLWLVGNVLWAAGQPIFRVVWWWGGFLILTIAGERLELARLTKLSMNASGIFMASTAMCVVALLLSLRLPVAARHLGGLGMISLAGWFFAYDIARRTIRQSGLTRYIAACLMAGYVWLAASGLMSIWVGFEDATAGPLYDAALHALFVGFVMSMIFGHGPIIVPAILGRGLAYRPVFYAPLALLHLSVLLRVGGDLLGWQMIRQTGGLLNAVAALAFAGCMVYGLLSAARTVQRPPE